MNIFARLLAVAGLMCATQALASPQLIPEPYPGQFGGNATQPPPPGAIYDQRLMQQPAPKALGPNALGNPQPRQTSCTAAGRCSTTPR
jgi:hypothetical protein